MVAPAPAILRNEDTATAPVSSEQATRATRAARIEAMLDRWAEEDCSDEPEWEVAEIPSFRLGVPELENERRGSEP